MSYSAQGSSLATAFHQLRGLLYSQVLMNLFLDPGLPGRRSMIKFLRRLFLVHILSLKVFEELELNNSTTEGK